jgi:hypothetical protein
MQRTHSQQKTKLSRLLREPTLHFFLLGAALFLAHRLVAGDPRTIVITPALKADVLRRFEDQMGGRRLSEKEAEALMENWRVEEALYREALREGLDREDPAVRNVLISKMRERATLQTRVSEPTEAQLQQYLAEHRDEYESPMIYEHEYVVFPKSEAGAEQKRAEAERQLKAGATTASIGLRSTVANVDRARIEQELGPDVADQITKLAPGEWHELESADRLILVKMIRKHGGPPPPEELHARLRAAWQVEIQQKAVASATKEVADRYHFVERSE